MTEGSDVNTTRPTVGLIIEEANGAQELSAIPVTFLIGHCTGNRGAGMIIWQRLEHILFGVAILLEKDI